MADSPLPVHSLAEAHLYLGVTSCPDCTGGALKATESDRHDDLLVVQVQCVACRAVRTLHFELIEGQWPIGDAADSGRINPSPEPSRIIDVAQWLTLFQVILQAAGKSPDREAARRLGYEAAQCLEESLKFYSLDSEEPPAEAFFSDSTRHRYSEHPEHFQRSRLISLRHRLPTLRHMERQIDGAAGASGARPWWQFWRRRG
jgi:hypothetical protein